MNTKGRMTLESVLRKIYNTVGPPLQPPMQAISGSIPAPTYTVPAGTTAWRVTDPPEEDTERFVTSRTVVFNTSDLIKEYHNAGVLYSYLFRLPSQAAPWNRLEVRVEDVVIQ